MRIASRVASTPRRIVATVRKTVRAAEAAEAAGMRTAASALALGATTATAVVKTGVGVAGKVGSSSARMMGATARAAEAIACRAAEGIRAATDPAAPPERRPATALPRHVAWPSRALLDLHPRRHRRHVWAEHGHAQIEVRGLEGRRARRVADAVDRAIRRLKGVKWAEVNALTGHLLVAYDEGRVDTETLLGTIQAVEKAQGTREDTFSWSRASHPGDGTPIAAATAELAADCVAVIVALTARAFAVPPVPRWIRLPLLLPEFSHGVRRRLKHWIGPMETEFVLALANAAVQGLSEGVVSPAIDAVYRSLLLAETRSRRQVWERREAELCFDRACVPTSAPERPPRPRPRPRGPIERWGDHVGPVAFGAAAAVFALTRSGGRAADVLLAAVPKAAKYGREGFATTIGWRLAREGTLPLDAAAFRRLDRVSAIVVDSAALCTDHPGILAPDAGPAGERAEVWQTLTGIVVGRPLRGLAGSRPWQQGRCRLWHHGGPRNRGTVSLVPSESGHRLGRIAVGAEPQPVAEAVLDAARATGAPLLLTAGPGVTELYPWADAVLDAGTDLTAHVRRLQEEGHGVMVVSQRDRAALSAADVGVVIPAAGSPALWSADLVCRPDAEDLRYVLRATVVAQAVSEHAVRLAQVGSALGVLLALVEPRRRDGGHALAPVYASALVALGWGAVRGLRATAGTAPRERSAFR